jgi:hypothetical protein
MNVSCKSLSVNKYRKKDLSEKIGFKHNVFI